MGSSKRIVCLMCSSKPAKEMPEVQDRVGSAHGPVFCSLRCAARYALIRVGLQHEHGALCWCSDCGAWILNGWSAHRQYDHKEEVTR